ncbi:hypothetical protein HYV83_02830 [Candidatus Woesearchaeota archaeon]|nr:hypothetical protein [Candidatus Woesearchaeota archaeon]
MGDFLDSYLDSGRYHLGTIDGLILNGGSSRETKLECAVHYSVHSEHLKSAAVFRTDRRIIEVEVEYVAGVLAQIRVIERIFSLPKRVSVFRTEDHNGTRYNLLNEDALARTRPNLRSVVALVAPLPGKEGLAEFSGKSADLLSNNYRLRYGKEISGCPLYEIITHVTSELVERQQKTG